MLGEGSTAREKHAGSQLDLMVRASPKTTGEKKEPVVPGGRGARAKQQLGRVLRKTMRAMSQSGGGGGGRASLLVSSWRA